MASKPTQPLSKEDIVSIDGMRAKFFLVVMLCEIPQFLELWEQARRPVTEVIERLGPDLKERLLSVSPESIAAQMGAISESHFSHSDDSPGTEGTKAALRSLLLVLGTLDANSEGRTAADYFASLERIVEPLGVPDLVTILVFLDFRRWKLDNLFSNTHPTEGPLVDALQIEVLGAMTDLSPLELTQETPGKIISRSLRKIGPLSWHMKRYDLWGRVDLWLVNVVFGQTHEEISKSLESDESRVIKGRPYSWITRQVPDTSRLLGVHRRGRPRKLTVLDHWNDMIK